MLTLMAKLKCNTIWENLLIPPFIFFSKNYIPSVQLIKNERELLRPQEVLFYANRNYLKKKLYENIKNKIIDDCNIAKEIKQRACLFGLA